MSQVRRADADLAVVTKPESIQSILDSLAIASQAPRFRPARATPQGNYLDDSYDYTEAPALE